MNVFTKCHQDLKKKEENKDYLYVSANIESKTVVTFGINSKSYFRKRSVHINIILSKVCHFFIVNVIYTPLKKSKHIEL